MPTPLGARVAPRVKLSMLLFGTVSKTGWLGVRAGVTDVMDRDRAHLSKSAAARTENIDRIDNIPDLNMVMGKPCGRKLVRKLAPLW